jgi:hypothetical protein
MDESYYAQFLSKQLAGLKEEARTAIQRFVESFNDLEEKEDWTRKLLSTHEPSDVVRHELYQEVIFPVLLAGYERRDPWSLYWLAETSKNLFKAKHLYQRIGSPPPQALLKEAYALAPSSVEIREGLLRDLLRGFEYMAHEWPAGLLYYPDQTWQTQYWEVLADIRLARELDTTGAHAQEIAEFEQIVAADATRKRR